VSERGRRDVALNVEIIEPDGTVVAGEQPGPQSAAAPEPPRQWIWILGAAVLILAAAISARLLTGGRESEPVIGEPLGILSRPYIGIDEETTNAAFPLFGRNWQHDLVFTSGSTVTAIDLNTGDQRALGSLGVESGFRTVRVINGTVHVAGFDGIYELSGGESRRLSPPISDGTGGQVILGNYWTEQSPNVGDSVLTHLLTGVEVSLIGVTDFTVVDDDIFFEKGGRIGRLGDSDTGVDWAAGELLATGPSRVAWRECRSPDDCSYWAGTAHEPREVPLVADAEAALVSAPATSRGLRGATELLSPSGRYAWTDQRTETDFGVDLVDLQTGGSITIDNLLSVPVFSPDESTMFTTNSGSIIAIDTETGTFRRIRTGGVNVFVPFTFIPA
jgi:hypothetical protein